MSESVDSDNPTFDANLPVMVSDHDNPPTLPSSKSYEVWAASCPEIYHDFGRSVGVARAKVCPFCGNPKRLGHGSNQSLIEHMKSRACVAIQQRFEREIIDAPTNEEMGYKPRPGTLNLSSNTLSLTPASSIVSFNAHIDPLPCEGAEIKLSRTVWGNYPWHLHDPNIHPSKALSFFVCAQNRTGDTIRIRSHFCVGFVPGPQHTSCDPCTEAAGSREVTSIIRRVETEKPVNGLNRIYCSHKQLCDLLNTKDETLKKYRLYASISEM